MISASSLLLFAPLLAPAQDSPFAETLMLSGGPAPYSDGSTDPWVYTTINNPRVSQSGGWVTSVVFRRVPAPSDFVNALVGQRTRQLGGPIEVFGSWPVFGRDRGIATSSSFAGAELTYLFQRADPTSGAIVREVIREGVALVQLGDEVLGSNGWTWSLFNTVTGTTDGSVFVEGFAIEPTLGVQHFMVAEVAFGSVLVNGFDFVPGVPRRLAAQDEFAVSADGSHWALAARMRQTNEAVLVADGAVYEFAAGFPALEGELAPSELVGSSNASWTDFRPLQVTGDGDLTLAAEWNDGATGSASSVFRNGRRVTSDSLFSGTDDRGVLMTVVPNGSERRLSLDGKPSQIITGIEVDTDRDGLPEPSIFISSVSGSATPVEGGALLIRATFSDPFSTVAAGLVRLRDYRLDQEVCEGSPNSTGFGAKLSVSGSRHAVDNQFTVDLLELPAQSRGYLLFSTSTGTPIQPPGSDGLLCLSGGIGRLQSGLFQAPDSGQARVEVDLTAIPQPTGSVPAMAGETWFTQAWFRDSIQGTATSNFTSAASVTFR